MSEFSTDDKIFKKLKILADAAKYDVSCSSSGSKRTNHNKGLGNASHSGICHTYTQDGRCVSLLKILLTNHCVYDCKYCVSRKSNDISRAAFTVDEVVSLTMNFYRRNYIEGLFLSSGILKNADYTMERMVAVAKKLRTEQKFNGYIHLKTIPGASEGLMREAGLYADRLSINIELPTENSLQSLAPQKNFKQIETPMLYVSESIEQYNDEKKIMKYVPTFAPAGQSSQIIVGATADTDRDIITTANRLYQNYQMKRVYYSGYIPIQTNNALLPQVGTPPPLIREHRLYQTDWLYRFYGFDFSEIVNDTYQHLELDIDPKLSWALRNLHHFPIDINTAGYEMILRIPGVGVQSAKKIIAARRYRKLDSFMLKKLGIAYNRAKYFLVCNDALTAMTELLPQKLKQRILTESKSKYEQTFSQQLQLFV